MQQVLIFFTQLCSSIDTQATCTRYKEIVLFSQSTTATHVGLPSNGYTLQKAINQLGMILDDFANDEDDKDETSISKW